MCNYSSTHPNFASILLLHKDLYCGKLPQFRIRNLWGLLRSVKIEYKHGQKCFQINHLLYVMIPNNK